MKTIPFSIRFTEAMHSFVQRLSKSSGKSPTEVIEAALNYQRLDFRMNYLGLQKNTRFNCLNLIKKWQKKEFISPEEYAFLAVVCHYKYLRSGTVGVRQVESLLEITHEIQLHLDAKKIDYDKAHLNKYLQEGYVNSFKENRSANIADILTRPIERLADYFDEIDAISLHKIFMPHLDFLLPLALFEASNSEPDEDCYERDDSEKDELDRFNHANCELKSTFVNLGDITVKFYDEKFLIIEGKSFLFPIFSYDKFFITDVLLHWDARGGNVEYSYKNIKVTRFVDARVNSDQAIIIENHGMRVYFTEEQFGKVSQLVKENMSGDWLKCINRYKLSIGSLW
jgi:hypothetical protein